MAEARRAWIGLGGNLGEVSRAFDSALEALAATPGLAVLARSALYRTTAWGVLEQPSFLNAAVALESRLGPIELLDRLMAVERQHGRDRTRERRWGPRRLDLDLLAIDGVVLQHPRLLLPHPRAHERAFVLVPWAEIAPDFLLPGHGRLADLRDALDRSGIEAIP
jgi:2-amino-4-hydroxy-6-hydroxymethyldihydropteridine diphosphokinase